MMAIRGERNIIEKYIIATALVKTEEASALEAQYCYYLVTILI